MLGHLQAKLARLAPDVGFVKGSLWDGFADGHGGDGYLNLHDGPYKAQVGRLAGHKSVTRCVCAFLTLNPFSGSVCVLCRGVLPVWFRSGDRIVFRSHHLIFAALHIQRRRPDISANA
jgi:hypothetical protein